MGILDDYLNDTAAPETPAAKVKPSGSVLNQYFDDATSEKKSNGRIYVSPAKPPISGVSKEQSDIINSEPAKAGGENPRDGISSLPVKAGEAVYDAAKGGVLTAGQGLGDILSNKPATGFGKVGSGALSVLTSPVAGVEQLAGDVTGSPDIANRAGFVAGALPVAGPLSRYSPFRIPTPSNLNPITTPNIVKSKALSTLVDNIGRENLPAVVSAMKSNPRLAPADLSPRVLQDTQHLFTQDGPQIDYLAKASAARVGGAKEAVETAYDAATGLPVNAVDKLKELKKTATDVGSNQINPAIAASKPVDVAPVLDHIDSITKPGVNKVITSESTLPSTEINKQLTQIRSMLANAKEQRTDPLALHHFQSVLRQTADELLNSADGASRRMGKALMETRNQLVSAIDTASGGKYKPALSNYRDAKQIDDAFHHGYESIFTNSKKLEGRPEFTEQWFKGLSDAEKSAAREGARLQLDTQINNFRFAARKGMEIPEVEFNRQKLELLFGKDKTDKLIQALKDERAIANTHNKVIEGSQTAMRSASKSQFALPTKTEVMKSAPAVAATEAANFFMGGYPGIGSAALAVAKGGAMAKDAVKLALARNHNAQYAKYALPTEGPSRDELIKALEARIPGPKPSLLSRGANALSKFVP